MKSLCILILSLSAAVAYGTPRGQCFITLNNRPLEVLAHAGMPTAGSMNSAIRELEDVSQGEFRFTHLYNQTNGSNRTKVPGMKGMPGYVWMLVEADGNRWIASTSREVDPESDLIRVHFYLKQFNGVRGVRKRSEVPRQMLATASADLQKILSNGEYFNEVEYPGIAETDVLEFLDSHNFEYSKSDLEDGSVMHLYSVDELAVGDHDITADFFYSFLDRLFELGTLPVPPLAEAADPDMQGVSFSSNDDLVDRQTVPRSEEGPSQSEIDDMLRRLQD